MIQLRIAYIFLLATTLANAQVNYEVKLMSWNLLNFPSGSNTVADTTDRCPSYRTVVNYIQPDILITCENTSTNGVSWFRDQVMNTGNYHYALGTFINGYDTDNAIYYRDSLFDFLGNNPVQTSLRDINEFTLRFKATGDTLHIFSCHLKASQGYETQRAAEVADLRQFTNTYPAGTNFLIGGDFNIYTSYEPAYLALLEDNSTDDGNFLDAITITGTWNNPSYAAYHTQSTHISSTGGFSGGGMNDRFDMILYSNGVAQPGGVYYMPGTYKNIGNDGNHFDDNINYGVNTSVPSAVANALYNTSDHIPIVMTLMIGPTSGIEEHIAGVQNVDVFPNPVTQGSGIQFSISTPSKVGYFLTDNLGRILVSGPTTQYGEGEHFVFLNGIEGLENGYYLLSININNTLINKHIEIIK